MTRIDAHQHFWQYHPHIHAWISDDMSVLKKDFLPADLEPLLRDNGISGCVAVQASTTEEETHFLLQQAERYNFIRGVVGWTDLQDYNIRQNLRHWSSYPLLKGFRHTIQSEPDPEFMLQPAFMRGVKALAEFNFTYDLLIVEQQLPVALQFISYIPEVKVVIDHIAKPDIAGKSISPWQENIRSLAQYPNVYCKISGMVTEADLQNWQAADFTPYLDTVTEAFGSDRLMIGSDWPVCQLAADYGQVMQVVNTYFQAFSAEEQAKIFGQNAIDFYHLKL